MISLTKELIQHYNTPGPRYTSYPTAPEWSSAFTQEEATHALASFGKSGKPVSVYIHIPFCATMCYYCGCNVTIRKPKGSVGDEYIEYLQKELELVSRTLPTPPLLKQLHWGGGTPNFLTESQSQKLYTLMQTHFKFDSEAEIALEIDPRTVTLSQIAHYRQLGFNRISMGIQDFNADVQKAVNRIQPFEHVETLMKELRRLQFDSVNMDLIYGLPFQSVSKFLATIDHILELNPDRIALYSFAHIPWLKSHQNLISETTLPDSNEKLDIFISARNKLLESGYDAIAMDHFAKSEDAMSKAFKNKTLYRNFMGYTLKPAEEFIGLGVTSIGYLNHTFMQNAHELKTYYASLDAGVLPTAKGLKLSQDDIYRQWVIGQLMCQFKVDKIQFETLFSQNFDHYFEFEHLHIHTCEKEGLVTCLGSVIEATELGRLFIRNICMGFDWYFRQENRHKRFSKTV